MRPNPHEVEEALLAAESLVEQESLEDYYDMGTPVFWSWPRWVLYFAKELKEVRQKNRELRAIIKRSKRYGYRDSLI
jgi:hypothetical protein